MSRYFDIALTLALSSLGSAQSPLQSSNSEVRHYRLTVVIDSGQSEAGKQSLTLDVPVASGKPGAARANLVSGSDGDAASLVQQRLECNDVHATSTGLALRIAMQFDREAPAIPGLISARHQHGDFARAVVLEMGKPTVVTQEMQFQVLGDTDPKLAAKLRQPAPTITVTAEAL